MGTRRSLRVTKAVVVETVTTEDDDDSAEEWPVPKKNKRPVRKPKLESSKLKERNDKSTDKISVARKSVRKPTPKRAADHDTDYEELADESTGTEDDADHDDVEFSVPRRPGAGSGKNKGALRRPSSLKAKKPKRKLKVNNNLSPKEESVRPTVQKKSTSKTDFSTSATAFIASESNSSPSSFWCRPRRVTQDPLISVVQNALGQIANEEDIGEYLPSLKESVTFKTISESSNKKSTKPTESEFKNLAWFEGKVVDTQEGNFLYNAGGPILGLGWHPNGKLLAVSTASHPSEDIDYKLRTERKSCIQIYQHYYEAGTGKVVPKHYLVPQLFICTEYGYATHLQWCNFWPDCWDNDTATFCSDNKYDRIGHLACSFEDGTIRIFSFRISDLFMIGTFLPGTAGSSRIPVYRKSAEMCLRIDSSVYPNAGQACKFEWHEDNKFLAVAYYSGVVAVFDVQTTSTLLAENVIEDSQDTTRIVNPFWCFQAHLGPINGLSFDPMSPRFFVTGSKDRNLKLWDLHLRQEIECRKIGLIHDICWVRGWINVAVAVDAAISNLSSQYNFVRFYQIGTSQPRPNCAEFMDISSLSFHEGLTIQGTERGNITCTYFDNFWREMDYERNKKKHNVVNILKTDLDLKSFDELSQSDFTEASSGPRKKFPDKDKAPRIILTFLKERIKTVLPDPKPQFFENFIRFLPYLRINKVSWCPAGGCFVTGYRNGLLTIIPANFGSLYS